MDKVKTISHLFNSYFNQFPVPSSSKCGVIMTKRIPIIRVCRFCNFIFNVKKHKSKDKCPMCSNDSNSAKAVYGKSAYSYLKSQKPYFQSQARLANEKTIEAINRIDEQSKQYLRDKISDALNIPKFKISGIPVATGAPSTDYPSMNIPYGKRMVPDLMYPQIGNRFRLKPFLDESKPATIDEMLEKIKKETDELIDKELNTLVTPNLGIYSSIKNFFGKKDNE